jgi:hypothetical protein
MPCDQWALQDLNLGYEADPSAPEEVKGPLWDLAHAEVEERRYLNEIGAVVPLVKFEDPFVLGPLLLVVFGAGAGLTCYGAWELRIGKTR